MRQNKEYLTSIKSRKLVTFFKRKKCTTLCSVLFFTLGNHKYAISKPSFRKHKLEKCSVLCDIGSLLEYFLQRVKELVALNLEFTTYLFLYLKIEILLSVANYDLFHKFFFITLKNAIKLEKNYRMKSK